MKLSRIFKGPPSPDKIASTQVSSPHTEQKGPLVVTRAEAQHIMPSLVKTHTLPFSHAKLSKKGPNIVQRTGDSLCSMDSLKFGPKHLASMAELRAMCSPEHHPTINKALDGIFMMTVASESLSAFRAASGNRTQNPLDLTTEQAVSALHDSIDSKYRELKQAFGVDLGSLNIFYEAELKTAAVLHISHLAVSIAYDQGR